MSAADSPRADGGAAAEAARLRMLLAAVEQQRADANTARIAEVRGALQQSQVLREELKAAEREAAAAAASAEAARAEAAAARRNEKAAADVEAEEQARAAEASSSPTRRRTRSSPS